MIIFFFVLIIRCIFVGMENRTYLMKVGLIIFAFVALHVFVSCSSEYLIEGNSSVTRLDGKMLFLKVSDGSRMIKIDSAEVVHGLFRMEGEIDSAFLASLYMDDLSIMPLVVEKGTVQIRIDDGRITASGTPLNEKLYEFVAKKNALDDRAYEMERKESHMIMDGRPLDIIEKEILKERDILSKELDLLVKLFIQENYENVLGPGLFAMLGAGFPYPLITPLIEEIMEDAPESFKTNKMVKEYMEAAHENMKKLNAEQ